MLSSMKKIIISFLFLFLITACDKISHPVQGPPKIFDCIDPLNQVIKTNANKNPDQRKVLLEDFTGHYCPNCPRAAKVAETLMEQNPGNVILLAHHVTTTYAKISTDTTNKFKENFMNDASNDWDSPKTGFGVSGAGLPQGMVNRIGNPNFAQADSKWASLVSTELNKPLVARLDLETTYDLVSHYLIAKVKATFKQAVAHNVNVVFVLSQDSIVACQKDNNPLNAPNDRDPDEPQTRLNFHFNHITINAMNGAQGEVLKSGPIAINDTASLTSSCFLLNKCFGADNATTFPPYKAFCIDDRYVSLVAFIYDADTKEVLQAETMRIR
ncbi:hypothetical protein CNR22_07285 [Sphingobacteriaceae bacterium]|nr:hypothetical protein CNR22_07285 [Sphingobacteriaceae bacterium]